MKCVDIEIQFCCPSQSSKKLHSKINLKNSPIFRIFKKIHDGKEGPWATLSHGNYFRNSGSSTLEVRNSARLDNWNGAGWLDGLGPVSNCFVAYRPVVLLATVQCESWFR